VDPAVVDSTLFCARCHSELDGDPDEDPSGDGGRPICGDCAREREARKGFEDDLFLIDSLDGSLDGKLDLDAEWD
jgi:hypothetical protein